MTKIITIAMLSTHCVRNIRLFRPLLRSKSFPLITRSSLRSIQTSRVCFREDYYKKLGVDKNANQKDIKKAYYQLAKRWHPDTNKNDPMAAKKFQEVSEAYEVLSDESKRRQYDQFGSTADAAGPQGFSGFQGFQSNIDPEELFRNIFGDFARGFGEKNFSQQEMNDFGFSAPQEIQLSVSFKEAAKGCTKEVKINVIDTCPKCKGSRFGSTLLLILLFKFFFSLTFISKFL